MPLINCFSSHAAYHFSFPFLLIWILQNPTRQFSIFFLQKVLDKYIDIFILIYISIMDMVLMEIKFMEDSRQFEKISKALADPRRVEVFEMISQYGEISCGNIAKKFPVKQSTISHHLRILVESGLVDVRREGQFGYFSPRKDVIESYINELRKRLLKEPAKPQIVDEQN